LHTKYEPKRSSGIPFWNDFSSKTFFGNPHSEPNHAEAKSTFGATGNQQYVTSCFFLLGSQAAGAFFRFWPHYFRWYTSSDDSPAFWKAPL
jgi:hypothetical protein